jgi:hypothetical protein
VRATMSSLSAFASPSPHCSFRLAWQKEDDLYSAARKLGISPTEDQRNRAKEYLKVIDRQHRVVLDFLDGRLFTVWKQRANKLLLPTPASGTPAASAPVAPQADTADH